MPSKSKEGFLRLLCPFVGCLSVCLSACYIISDTADTWRNFGSQFGGGGCSRSLNFGYQMSSEFTRRLKKTTENLDSVGRSQDLPDAHCLMTSSPTFKQTNLNGSPHCAVALCVENLQTFRTDILVTGRWDKQETLQHFVNFS